MKSTGEEKLLLETAMRHYVYYVTVRDYGNFYANEKIEATVKNMIMKNQKKRDFELAKEYIRNQGGLWSIQM